MNKNALIKLGVLAEKLFRVDNNFEIMEIASDWNIKIPVRIMLPQKQEYFIGGKYPESVTTEYDQVILKPYQIEKRIIHLAYSQKAKMLVILEAG